MDGHVPEAAVHSLRVNTLAKHRSCDGLKFSGKYQLARVTSLPAGNFTDICKESPSARPLSRRVQRRTIEEEKEYKLAANLECIGLGGKFTSDHLRPREYESRYDEEIAGDYVNRGVDRKTISKTLSLDWSNKLKLPKIGNGKLVASGTQSEKDIKAIYCSNALRHGML